MALLRFACIVKRLDTFFTSAGAITICLSRQPVFICLTCSLHCQGRRQGGNVEQIDVKEMLRDGLFDR